MKERCLFRSPAKQAKWYLASSATRSPQPIVDSNAVSCRSVAIRFTFSSASSVLNSWRRPLCSLQNIQHFLLNGSRCRRRFVSDVMTVEVSFLFLFLALCSLSTENFKWQDLCHLAWFVMNSSISTSSPKFRGTGSWSSSLNWVTFCRNDE